MQIPYPPYQYLCQVADYCPTALSTYIMLWRDFFQNNDAIQLFYDRKKIVEDRCLRWTKFKNDLTTLGRFGLLDRHEVNEDIISVNLAEWFEDEV